MSDAAARNFQFLAYGLVAAWAILVVYVLTLAARGRNIQKQIETLKRMIEDRDRK
jgi:CcmD family protein